MSTGKVIRVVWVSPKPIRPDILLRRTQQCSNRRGPSCQIGSQAVACAAGHNLRQIANPYDCQTVSGSAFYTAYVVPLESVTLTKGAPGGFSVKSDKGRDNRRRFCKDCGTRLWAELEMGFASVNGMALDDRSHFNPTHNHRLETAPGWCALNALLETLPITP